MSEEELEQFKSRRRRRALQRENSETQKEEKRDWFFVNLVEKEP